MKSVLIFITYIKYYLVYLTINLVYKITCPIKRSYALKNVLINFPFNYCNCIMRTLVSSHVSTLYNVMMHSASMLLQQSVKVLTGYKPITTVTYALKKKPNLHCLPLTISFASTMYVSHYTNLMYSRRYMHRFVPRVCTCLQGSGAPQNSTTILRFYAINRAHTPEPTTSSQDGLNNNKLFYLKRKNGVIVGQHTEWTVQKCYAKDCKGNICTALCDQAHGTKTSVGHFTHSPDHAMTLLGEVDLEGQKRTQYTKTYSEPHKTTSTSRSPESDKNKTAELNHALQKLKEKNDNEDI